MICNCRIAYILVCIWEDILKCNAYIHACAVCSFNDLTDDRTALYAHSFLCAYVLLCDQRVRRERCDGWQDREICILTYSLTASHCSTEAHLAGVPFPRSFDSCLVLRQRWSTRLKSLVWYGLQNWAGWPSLDQVLPVLQMCARKSSHTARKWKDDVQIHEVLHLFRGDRGLMYGALDLWPGFVGLSLCSGRNCPRLGWDP